MRHLFNLSVFTLLTITLIGCLRDKELDIKGSKGADVVLQLTSPGGYTKATKGLTLDQENAINNVYVLVFNNSDILTDIRKANNISTGSGAVKTFTVSLTPSETEGAEHKQKLVIFSNAEEILGNTIGKTISEVRTDKSYANIITAIKGEINGKMYAGGGEIPMWGETGLLTIKGGNSNGSGMANPINLPLMRCVARIDLGIGTHSVTDGINSWDGINSAGSPIPFKLNTIYVISPNKEYIVTPAITNRSTESGKNIVTAPTFAGGKFTFDESITKFSFTSPDNIIYPTDNKTYGGYTTQSIYLPEADVKMGENGASGDSNHTNRLAIVVGGFYNGSATQTFYRLDVANAGVIKDLLRNHLYQFNVTEVSGAGHISAEQAYKSQSMNMQVEVIEWNDAQLGDIEFDGQNYFSISERKVVFTPLDGQTAELKIKTNVRDFEIEKSDGTQLLKATGTTTYTDTQTGFKYTLTKDSDSEENYNLIIEATKHNVFADGVIRENDLRIKASRLVLPLNLQQQTASEFISAPNESIFTYTPVGTTAGEDLEISIITGSPVKVEQQVGTNAWVTVTPEGLSTPVNGLYKGKVKIKVGPYAKQSANDVKRESLIKITPQGQESTNINIVQMAPYLRIATGSFEIPRTAPQYKKVVTIQTNLPISSLNITYAGSDNGHTRITHDQVKGLYKMENQDGVLAFDVNSNMSGTLPTNAYRKTFTVNAHADYGKNDPVNAVFTVMAEGSFDLFKHLWDKVELDATKKYIFPWQEEKVEFKIVSGVGLALYTPDKIGNAPHSGTITEGTSFTDANYNNVYPFTFTFNNSSYATVKSYLLMFSNATNTHSVDMAFSQSAQQFNKDNYTPTLTGIGYKGYPTTAPSNVTITSNVEWSVKSNGVDWISLKKGGDEWGLLTTNPIVRNDKITQPIEITEGKDVNTQTGQNKSTTLSFAILPYNVFNGASPRTAEITLTNHSYSAEKGSITQIETTNVTQYAPTLGTKTHNVNATIPAAGGTYTIVANTNLQGWGVKVLNGLMETLVSKPFGTTPTIGEGTPTDHSLEITVPANTGTSQRPLNFILYCTEFTGTANEVSVANETQDIYRYTVTYDGNGHTSGELPSPQTVTNGTNINIAQVGTMVKEHSDFKGWSTQKTGGTLLIPGAQFAVTQNTTLYAQWTDKVYTITLNGNGVANPAAVTGINGTVIDPLPTLTRSGYEFKGWNTSSSATTGAMTHAIGGDATLYAVWIITQYTVTFDANGGTGTPPVSVTTYVGGSIHLPTQGGLTKTNCLFVGWSSSAGAPTGDAPATFRTPASNETLYAIWYDIVGVTRWSPRIAVVGTGDNAMLVIAPTLKWDKSNGGVQFKFGSVIAIYNMPVGDEFSSDDVAFNPTTISNPSWSQILASTTKPQHNVNGLKSGRGDPCRLIGYTQSQIKQMLNENKLPDNNVWRMWSGSGWSLGTGFYKKNIEESACFAVQTSQDANVLPWIDRVRDRDGVTKGMIAGYWWSTSMFTEVSTYCAKNYDDMYDTEIFSIKAGNTAAHNIRCVRAQ